VLDLSEGYGEASRDRVGLKRCSRQFEDACVSGDESTVEVIELGELEQMQRVFGMC
jgi:hypothetical protein